MQYWKGEEMTSMPVMLYVISKLLSLVNPISLRKVEIVYNFGLSQCSRVNVTRFP